MKKVLTVLNKYYKMLSTSDIGRKVTLKISKCLFRMPDAQVWRREGVIDAIRSILPCNGRGYTTIR